MLDNKFNFFIPAQFEKAKNESGKEEMKIKGICSSAVEDSDEEILFPSGFNFQPLLKTGFFNYNHQSNKNAEAIIGQPTYAEVINDGRDFYIEGFLYQDDPQAKAVWNKAKILEKNSPDRRFGFSIEGKATKRDPLNEKRILEAIITGVAITPCPKNPNTLLEIMKGEYSESFVTPELEDANKYYNIISQGGEVVETNLTYDEAVKKNDSYDGKIVPVSKAITAEGSQIAMESVEGGQEKLKNLVDSNRTLKKSEVYNFIWEKFPDIIFDIEKSKQVFELINNVGQKHFNMENNNITEDVIKKSYEILDTAFNLVKSEDEKAVESKEEETDEKEKTAENVEKSEVEANDIVKGEDLEDEDEDMIKKMAKKRLDKGMDAESCINDMVTKGISLDAAQTAVEKVVAEVNALKAGEIETAKVSETSKEGLTPHENSTPMSIEHLVPAIVKGITEELLKSNNTEVLENLIKSQSSEIGTRFQAISNIQKSFDEKIDTLKKGYEETINTLTERIEGIEQTPQPRKSVSRVVEKFEKGHGGEDGSIKYSLGNRDERQALTEVLFEKAIEIQHTTNRPNASLERAIQDIEATKSLDERTYGQIKPLLKSMNIDIVK